MKKRALGVPLDERALGVYGILKIDSATGSSILTSRWPSKDFWVHWARYMTPWDWPAPSSSRPERCFKTSAQWREIGMSSSGQTTKASGSNGWLTCWIWKCWRYQDVFSPPRSETVALLCRCLSNSLWRGDLPACPGQPRIVTASLMMVVKVGTNQASHHPSSEAADIHHSYMARCSAVKGDGCWADEVPLLHG